MSSSSAWSSAPSVSPSATKLPSSPPVADDTSGQQIAPISLVSPPPSPPPASLPLPPPPQVVVASPPSNSEPPLTTPPLPPPATPTQPVISPASPSPTSTTPYSPPPQPPVPPSATATPIAPPPPSPQPPTPAPPLTSPPPIRPETSPPISPLTPETSSPPPPDVPLRPTLSSPPPSASALQPRTPPLSPTPTSTLAPPTTKPSGSPLPPAVTSQPPPPTSPQAPKYLTSLPPPQLLVNRSLPAKPGTVHISTGLAVGCVIGVIILVIILLGLLFFCCQYRRKKKHGPVKDYYKSPCLAQKGTQMLKVLPNPCPLPPRMDSGGGSGSRSSRSENPIPPQASSVALCLSRGTFTYDQLVVATNGFSEANLLGQGGFGYVHKGVLPSGQEIAVKQLKTDSHQGEREFQAEFETISRVHHKHLVSLVGYCITGAQRSFVYEFVPNKTLEFHLHGKGQPVIDWAARMKIAIGSAKGLAYLHEDCNPTIIHRDIKASNILLDFRFEAKVSDFGLAKIFSDTNTSITHISTRVVGTFGYLAPEYASSGKVTDKSDVYSYGVMLLELITGCPPISKTESSRNEGLVDSTRPLLSQALEDGNFDALADPRLLSNYNTSEMARMVACATACVRHSAWLRPRMSQIVHALEEHVSPMDLDEGMRPGHSTLYRSSGSSNFDANKCMNFNMTIESQEYGFSRYSESTSEYGVNPSSSSSEFQQTT